MDEPQPDNKKFPWMLIAGALVLALVIYIFTGPYRPPPPLPPVPMAAPSAPSPPS